MEEIHDYLCKRYGIEELDYETQYKVLSIWQELQMYAFLSKPVVIAYDVNMNTVAQIEAPVRYAGGARHRLHGFHYGGNADGVHRKGLFRG